MEFTYNNKNYELILLIISGSRLYGNNTKESDYDYRGVFIESIKDKIGILSKTEQINSSNVLEQFKDIIPKFSDDITLYEINRFAKLAIDNNPNIMDILNIKFDDPSLLYYNKKGFELLQKSKLFLSSKIKFTFSGYAISQLKRIKGHYKMINLYPDIYEIQNKIEDLYIDKKINLNFINDNFNGELSQHIKDKYTDNNLKNVDCISTEILIDKYPKIENYIKPRIIKFCNVYNITNKHVDINERYMYEQTKNLTIHTTIKVFLYKYASFRRISNSVLAIYTNGKGIFTPEGNIKNDDYKYIGNFVFFLKIDHFNYKKKVDEIKKLWQWKINRNKKRSALEEKFGVDLKHMSHLYRLMLQAKSILQNGFYNPRLQDEDLKIVKGIRDGSLWGKKSYEKGIEFAERMDKELEELYKTTKLQKKVDIKKINELILKLRLN